LYNELVLRGPLTIIDANGSKKMSLKKLKILSNKTSLIVLVVILFAYWGVWNGFFQQDEWEGLGKNFYSLQGTSFFEVLNTLYGSKILNGFGRFLLLTPIANYFRYFFFGLNYPLYSLFSLVLHLVASLLVFRLVFGFTKNKMAAIFSFLAFGLFSSASQAVTWVGTSIPTQMATILAIVSLEYWRVWNKTRSRRDIYLSLLFLFLAISFKETAIFLIVMYPTTLFFERKESRRLILVSSVILGVVGAFAASNFSISGLMGTAKQVALNYVSLPIKSLTQLIFPQKLILSLADMFFLHTGLGPTRGTTQFDVFLQSQVITPLTYLVGVSLIIVSAVLVSKTSLKKHKRSLFFLGLFYLFSYIPLAILPGNRVAEVFTAPRNLYMPMAALAGILGIFLSWGIKNKSRLAYVTIILLFGMHIFYLRLEINALKEVGVQRKSILTKIKSFYPNLERKTVFYIKSDKAYYGLPVEEKILPFQSGLGQTLLVWYYEEEKFPSEFMQNQYLWKITSQGYREEGNRGFGYFRDLNLLKKAIAEYNLQPESVVAFSWDSKKELLVDITNEVRVEIGNEK